MIPRGFARSVAISCAVHPEPTTGASYDGDKMLEQVELEDWAKAVLSMAVVPAQILVSLRITAIILLLVYFLRDSIAGT